MTVVAQKWIICGIVVFGIDTECQRDLKDSQKDLISASVYSLVRCGFFKVLVFI